jgi:hypothetical protein
METFKNEKSKVLAELSDEKRLWNLALLCDVRDYLIDLNTKFRGQQKLDFQCVWACQSFLKWSWNCFGNMLTYMYVNRSSHLWRKLDRGSAQVSPLCNYALWCELSFQNCNQMSFESSSCCSILHLSVWAACLKGCSLLLWSDVT